MSEKSTSAGRPPPSSRGVSEQMKRMPRRDSEPEMALRRELHSIGLRFRIQYRGIPGTPDIAFTRARVAVFVDGCFWHQCPEHGVMPKANREWWRAKLEGNTERDRRKDRALLELGWLPFHVWEHEDVAGVASRIRDLWEKRIGSSWSPGRTDPPAFR